MLRIENGEPGALEKYPFDLLDLTKLPKLYSNESAVLREPILSQSIEPISLPQPFDLTLLVKQLL